MSITRLSRAAALCFWIAMAPFFHPALAACDPPKLAEFEVATVKPETREMATMIGFVSYPGGRVLLEYANLKLAMSFAFDIQEFQITGGPAWVETARYRIIGLPPDSSPSRTAKQPPIVATPTQEQREMLQSLLAERFGLKFHRESHEGTVLLLERGKGALAMTEPANKEADARFGFTTKSGAMNGEALGINLAIPFLARILSRTLNLPVLDRTGLTGHYDFHVDAFEPTPVPAEDTQPVVFEAIKRLGLELKSSKEPVETLVIDSATQPTED